MLIYPGVAPLDVAGPMQAFSVANFLTKRKLYDLSVVGPTAEPVQTRLGFALMPACAMTALPLPVDTLLVAGGGGPDAATGPDILAWLRQAAPKARRFGSICTGTFALGAAGFIEGKHVTTHWYYGAELARRHPSATVDLDRIFIRDGNVYSSAGITAGIDLALSMVEDDHGRDFALEVARFLVLFLKRSGGQAQFSTHLRSQFSTIPAIRQVQLWCHENLAGDLRVASLAKRAMMSERNFIRAFHDDTGQTPGEFVAAARLEAACRLLEETSLPPKAVAQRSGLGSVARMRRVFMRTFGVAPAHYRDKFCVDVAPALSGLLAAASQQAGGAHERRPRSVEGPVRANPT
jgi:transcriptional regulator GlxA family with amidase domain